MTPEEYGVYVYACAVSHSSGVFYAGLRATAEQFTSNKNVIARIVRSLEKKGWFEPIKTPTWDTDGKRLCKQFHVLSHDQWIQIHGAACPDSGTGTCPDSGTRKDGSRVQPLPPPVPQPVPPPVPKPGRSIESKFREGSSERSFEGKAPLAKQKREPLPKKTGNHFQETARFLAQLSDRQAYILFTGHPPSNRSPFKDDIAYKDIRRQLEGLSMDELERWPGYEKLRQLLSKKKPESSRTISENKPGENRIQ